MTVSKSNLPAGVAFVGKLAGGWLAARGKLAGETPALPGIA